MMKTITGWLMIIGALGHVAVTLLIDFPTAWPMSVVGLLYLIFGVRVLAGSFRMLVAGVVVMSLFGVGAMINIPNSGYAPMITYLLVAVDGLVLITGSLAIREARQ